MSLCFTGENLPKSYSKTIIFENEIDFGGFQVPAMIYIYIYNNRQISVLIFGCVNLAKSS